MTIINLTPHPINIGDRTIPPSGDVARVSVEMTTTGMVDGIPLVSGTYGEVTDLPDPILDTFYIVSAMVRLACPERLDLGSPAQLIRDDSGRIIGCESLEINRGV